MPLFKRLSLLWIALHLTGCAAVLIGAGAGGGYYVGEHYKIEKK